MTPIKVIAKKIPKPMISNLKIHCFIDELTKKASTYSGFIQSENYWNSNLRTPLNTSSLYIISDWVTVSDWLHWKSSKDRKDIINQSNMLFELSSYTILHKKILRNVYPLL